MKEKLMLNYSSIYIAKIETIIFIIVSFTNHSREVFGLNDSIKINSDNQQFLAWIVLIEENSVNLGTFPDFLNYEIEIIIDKALDQVLLSAPQHREPENVNKVGFLQLKRRIDFISPTIKVLNTDDTDEPLDDDINSTYDLDCFYEGILDMGENLIIKSSNAFSDYKPLPVVGNICSKPILLGGNDQYIYSLHLFIKFGSDDEIWILKPAAKHFMFKGKQDNFEKGKDKQNKILYSLTKIGKERKALLHIKSINLQNNYTSTETERLKRNEGRLKTKENSTNGTLKDLDNSHNDYYKYIEYLDRKYNLSSDSQLNSYLKSLRLTASDGSNKNLLMRLETYKIHYEVESLLKDIARFPTFYQKVLSSHTLKSTSKWKRCGVNKYRNQRLLNNPKPIFDVTVPLSEQLIIPNATGLKSQVQAPSKERNQIRRPLKKTPTIEIAVIADETWLKNLMRKEKIIDRKGVIKYILTIYQGVNYLYQDRTLGYPVQILVTHVFLFYKNPTNIPKDIMEAQTLLEKGTVYMLNLKVKKKYSWDAVSWLTGQDIYTLNGDRKDYLTEGLSYFGKLICDPIIATSIVEFTQGFASIPFIAHELGHNLNFDHDQDMQCPRGFIMSAYVEEAVKKWSKCTKKEWLSLYKDDAYDCLFFENPTDVARTYKRLTLPGMRYSLNQQCRNAYQKSCEWDKTQKLEDVCQSLRCTLRAPIETKFPALEGSTCGKKKVCRFHKCVTVASILAPKSRNNINTSHIKTQENAINPSQKPKKAKRRLQIIKPIVNLNKGTFKWTDIFSRLKNGEKNASNFKKRYAFGNLRNKTNSSSQVFWNVRQSCKKICLIGSTGLIRIVRRSYKRANKFYFLCSKKCEYSKALISKNDYANLMCKWLQGRQQIYHLTGNFISLPPDRLKEKLRKRKVCKIYCQLEHTVPGEHYVNRQVKGISLPQMNFPDGTECDMGHGNSKKSFCVSGQCIHEELLSLDELTEYQRKLPVSSLSILDLY